MNGMSWQEIRDNPLALLASIGIHLLLVALAVSGFDWDPDPVDVGSQREVIQAVTIDAERVDAELARLREADAEKARQIDSIRRNREREERRLTEIKQKQQVERKRLASIEQEKRAAEAALKKRQEDERQRLAELKRQKQTAEADLQRKQDVDSKRLAELELQKLKAVEALERQKQEAVEALEQQKRVAAEELERQKKVAAAELKKRQEAEKKRLAEIERKKRVEAERLVKLEAKRKAEDEVARRREDEAAQRRREMEVETARQDAERERLMESTAGRFVVIIKGRVTASWLRPPGLPKGLSCLLKISLNPFGEVLDVTIVRSSGNTLFDRSAEAAVKKASPLPVPPDLSIYNRYFREFQFLFKPEG